MVGEGGTGTSAEGREGGGGKGSEVYVYECEGLGRGGEGRCVEGEREEGGRGCISRGIQGRVYVCM